MNIYQHLAATDRPQFNEARRALQARHRKLSTELVEIPEEEIALLADGRINAPKAAWMSRDYLVQLYIDVLESGAEYIRVSINRVDLTNDGHWVDGIDWDRLMKIKAEIGLAERWAVEVFPPDEHLVNKANVRHLWIVNQPPFAWVKKGADQ